MQLKEYQRKCISDIRTYLIKLAEKRKKREEAIALDKDFDINFPAKAWEEAVKTPYKDKRNGLGEYLPNFCIKVPTGGGKTLLATHTIDLIQRNYLYKQTGFVLWIVPTTQIYEQTLRSLRNKSHPYRQVLEMCSGGKTLVLEKTDNFSPADVESQLVVMLLMLPSANRQNKETLKIFQDASGYDAFFPFDDNLPAHEELLKLVPNLDCFASLHHLYGKQIKTSLGNTLRILKPIVIIDEGQKAYSEGAIKTIAGFNPTMVVELSATPPQGANNLVTIKGRELLEEGMIKLDINVYNKANEKWESTLLSSVNKRREIEEEAILYDLKTGIYIRPINLIQVERTGKDQRDGKYIHAEDVKEFLINNCNVAPEEIAIKSSSQNDIEGIDLYDRNCLIRYIITKQALQEGWDCSFAYILTVLTNPNSKNAITQLVGRVLRQPNAKKIGNQLLDESYVFCFQQKANKLIGSIKEGLEGEGLGDLAQKVRNVEESGKQEIEAKIREQYKQYEGTIYLPRFIIQEKENESEELNYEKHLFSRIDWNELDIVKEIENEKIILSRNEKQDEAFRMGYSENFVHFTSKKEIREKSKIIGIDLVLMAKYLTKAVPNAWIAYDIAKKAVDYFNQKYANEIELVEYNTIFIVEELLKILEKKKDIFCYQEFTKLIGSKKLQLVLQKEKGYPLPKSIKIKGNYKNMAVKKSLFEPVDEEEYNELENFVAICLDNQKDFLAWHRNLVGKDHYYIKGYKPNNIYPDFLVIQDDRVLVLETKGKHLKGNEDTNYKKSLFEICNQLSEKEWDEVKQDFSTPKIEFQVIDEEDWENEINRLFENG